MSTLLKRIEKLEEANRPPPKVEPIRIIRLFVEPKLGATSSACGDMEIDRNEGEGEEEFRLRAHRTFNVSFKGPCVQAFDGDEDI